MSERRAFSIAVYPRYAERVLLIFHRRLAKTDPVLAGVLRAAGKYALEPAAAHTPFHAVARAIAHQQLNGVAAESIFGVDFTVVCFLPGVSAAQIPRAPCTRRRDPCRRV